LGELEAQQRAFCRICVTGIEIKQNILALSVKRGERQYGNGWRWGLWRPLGVDTVDVATYEEASIRAKKYRNT